MNCRSCNTPIPSRSSSCPNCGRSRGTGESFIDDPGASGSAGPSEESAALGPSTAFEDVESVDEELSLEDAVAAPAGKRSEAAAPAAPAPARITPKPASPAPVAKSSAKRNNAAASRKSSSPSPRSPATPAPADRKRSVPGPLALPDPDTVRAILAEHPELLEPGLEIMVDDGGQEIGVQHATDVGVIDLLAHDARGRLVAVIVAGPTSGTDLVAEALHRVGWVRKHLAKHGEDVRGIVVTDRVDAQLGYAAAAVADKISFKRYALSLTLTDLEL